MIPPNVAAPKTIVIAYPGAEDKLRRQYVYQTFLSGAEMARTKIVPGNRLIVKFKDDTVGEGQAILVEPTRLEKLTPYDAIVSGYEDVETLRKHLATSVLAGSKKAADTEFWKILYRWL